MAKGWLLLFAFLLPLASAVPCHPDDLRALRGFAGSLSGKGILSLRAAWSGVSCCGWEGVGCDAASGRVTALQLPGRGLVGPIPSWIGELDHLCYLDLSDNSLIGEVPKSVQIRLTTVARSLGMASTNRRALQKQPNTITGTHNKVISGRNNIVSGNDNTVRSGNSNTVSGSNNTVLSGSGNTISGSNHVVSGNNHIVTDNNNNVSGNTNNVSGSFQKVSSRHNTVSGNHNTVTGSHNTVSGNHNTVTGSNDTVSGSNHVVPESNRVVTGA